MWILSLQLGHSAITMNINNIEETERAPSIWKFHARLIEDEGYVALLNEKYVKWLDEGAEIQDPRVLWDFIKYKTMKQSFIAEVARFKEAKRANSGK